MDNDSKLDLYDAARRGDVMMVKKMIEREGVSVNLRSASGWTALHCEYDVGIEEASGMVDHVHAVSLSTRVHQVLSTLRICSSSSAFQQTQARLATRMWLNI